MDSVSRRGWLLAFASTSVVLSYTAQSLVVHLENDYLRVAAPNIHFLTGKPLERLRDGATVGYLGRLTVLTSESGPAQATAIERFAVSHDVFEDMDKGFKVTLATPGRRDKLPTKNRLTNIAAEAWCLDQLKIDLGRVPVNRPIWIRLEMSSEDPKETAGIVDTPGISLSKLIEVLSQPKRDQEVRLVEQIGPIKLEDLRKAPL